MVSRDFSVAYAGVPAAITGAVRHHAQLMVTRVQANASGRPGPNAPTGDYRRSWSWEPAGGIHAGRDAQGRFTSGGLPGDFAVAYVGTNKPQGRRLEFGFVGVDSLGRHYNQPP